MVRADLQETAEKAARAAIAGGFRMVEFTLTTPGAVDLISAFSSRRPDILVGAGTVMSLDEAEKAVDAGAEYLVSPVCDPEVIGWAVDSEVVMIPGAFTPTEMVRAHRLGARWVKLFPAPHDIPAHIRFVLGPLSYLKIFPTAGVTLDNMVDILRAGAAGLGFVGSLFPPDELANNQYSVIEQRAAAIVKRLQQSG